LAPGVATSRLQVTHQVQCSGQRNGGKGNVRRFDLTLAGILALIWVLFSGYWDHPLLLSLGLASVVLVIFLSRRLHILDPLGQPFHRVGVSFGYWWWLLGKILQANLHVARRILSPRMAIDPRIERLRISQQSELGRAILANSITLTPGTVTVHVRDREIWFYALDAESADPAVLAEMDRRAREFEGRIE